MNIMISNLPGIHGPPLPLMVFLVRKSNTNCDRMKLHLPLPPHSINSKRPLFCTLALGKVALHLCSSAAASSCIGCGSPGGTVVHAVTALAWQRDPDETEGEHIVINCDAARATSIIKWARHFSFPEPTFASAGPEKTSICEALLPRNELGFTSHMRHPSDVPASGLALHLFVTKFKELTSSLALCKRPFGGAHTLIISEISFTWQRLVPLQSSYIDVLHC